MTVEKCAWAYSSHAEENYHDQEWGAPLHDERLLFEYLILEGAQAGLSWSTILNKREGYRRAFDYFNVEKIARYDQEIVIQLLNNPEIVRNKLKIEATINNAKAFLKIQKEYGSFNRYIWQFVAGKSIQNHWQQFEQIPVTSNESEKMSNNLRQKGFKFVGATICYAYMQAIGMVNDHIVACFRHPQIKAMADE